MFKFSRLFEYCRCNYVYIYIISSPLFIFPLVYSFSPFISTMHCWKVLQDATGAKRVLHSLTLDMVWYYIIFCADARLFREMFLCIVIRSEYSWKLILLILSIQIFKFRSRHYLQNILNSFSTIQMLISIIYKYLKSLNKYVLEFI